MPTLQIEHAVRDYDTWKAAFDSDFVGREQGGVASYRIYQPLDDPNYVIVDLEFDTSTEADAFRIALRELWERMAAQGLVSDWRERLLETVETHEY